MPFKIKKIVRESDIVFTQTIGSIGAAAMYYAKSYKKPLISYIHSIEWELVPKSINKYKTGIGFITKRFARKMYNKCSVLLIPSKDTFNTVIQNKIKIPKEIVHLGVNDEEFCPAKNKVAAKKAIKLNPDDVIIGFIGELEEKVKRGPILIDGFDGPGLPISLHKAYPDETKEPFYKPEPLQ